MVTPFTMFNSGVMIALAKSEGYSPLFWSTKIYIITNHAVGKFSRWQTDTIYFFLENRIWNLMQIVSKGRRQFARNAKAYFLEKIRKYFKMSSAENFT